MPVPDLSLATLDNDAILRFERGWRSGTPEPIEACLPVADSHMYVPTLAELVQIDIEFAWKAWRSSADTNVAQASRPAAIEQYLERFPRLNEPTIVRQLAQHEQQVRQRLGEPADMHEYVQRFPQAFDGMGATISMPEAIFVPPPPSAPPLPEIPGLEILDILGRGGMGIVYRARQTRLQRIVAVKMILSKGAGPEDLARFQAEAAAIGQLKHANIVQVHEVGEAAGRPYCVLEYVSGGSLARALDHRPQPPREAARLVATLARAMHCVHERGIVHRDLKPANILLQIDKPSEQSAICNLQSAIPKITDFGLAKQLEGASGLTQSGAILGTPSYMAPEQAAGRTHDIGPAADIYGLGAILYELLTGQPPFTGPNVGDVIMRVMRDEPAPPRRLQARTPRDLDTICLKCLHKEPAKRYASAVALAEDLERYFGHRPILARPIGMVERSGKWVRRRPVAATLLGIAVLLLAFAGGMWMWYWKTYQAVAIEHYGHFVKRWGVPEGIGPLSAAEARKRDVSYKLYRRAGRIEKVEVVNGSGFLTGHHALGVYIDDFRGAALRWSVDVKHECRFEYRRNEQGQLTEEVATDAAGDVVWTFHFTTKNVGHFTDRRGFPSPRADSGAAYVELVWSEDGFEREVWYLDRFGQRRPAKNGIAGIRHELDARGLPTHLTLLDARGRPTLHRDGYAAIRRLHDADGQLIRETYLGLDGRPALHRDRFARVALRYHATGNLAERAYFGSDDKPVVTSWGYHKFTRDYDERGNVAAVHCFDPAGRPAFHMDGFASYTVHHDERGNPVEFAHFDAAGKPTLSKDGAHRWINRFDERGNILGTSYFDLDNRPTLRVGGFFRIETRYDARGNKVETAYHGLDDRLTWHRDGHARFVMTHDDHGKEISRAWFGPDDKPAWQKGGYAQLKWRYDDEGRVFEHALFDAAGKLVNGPDGAARIYSELDSLGNRTAVDRFDAADKPVPAGTGRGVRMTARYDERGNRTEEAWFGPDHQLAPRDKGGAARFTLAYDGRNNQIEKLFFDEQSKRRPGMSRQKWVYDAAGRVLELSNLDSQDRLIADSTNVARHVNRYDAGGLRVETSYYNAANKLAKGIARMTWKHDDHGRSIEEAYWDADGKPYIFGGYARFVKSYDERGNFTGNAFFGADRKPVLGPERMHKWLTRTDARKNKIEQTYFDVNGELVLAGQNHVAKFTQEFDARDNRVNLTFYGLKGERILNRDGVSRMATAHDARDRLIETTYFDAADKRTSDRYGVSGIKLAYDARGRLHEETYFDAQDRLRENVNKVARVVYDYDERGKRLPHRAFGLDGTPR